MRAECCDLDGNGYPVPAVSLSRILAAFSPAAFRLRLSRERLSGTRRSPPSKLEDRVKRGVGNPCPLLLIGLPDTTVTFGEDPAVVQSLIAEGADGAD